MSEALAAPTESTPAAPPSGDVTVTETPAQTPGPTPQTSWRDSLGDELRDNPSLTKFDDVGGLAKSYVEVSSLIGKKGLIPPDEHSTPEQVNEFYTALGRPETPEGYEAGSYEPPEILAEIWDVNGVAEVTKAAHELGVSKEQFAGLVDALAQSQARNLEEHIQSVEQRRESVTSELTKEWGATTPQKMDHAKRGFAAAAESAGLSVEELAGQLLPDGSLIGDNAALTKIFATLGEQGGELGFRGGKGGRGTLTPAEAKAEAAELLTHEGMLDRSHPEHKALVSRREALLKMAYPEE